MTGVLLRFGAKTCAVAVGLAFLVGFIALGESGAVATAFGGALTALNFLGLVYVIGRLLDARVTSRRKLALSLALLCKMAVVGILLWLGLTRFGLDPLGLVIGIGAAILGFTLGLARGSASPEGKSAMAAEEARLREEGTDGDEPPDPV